MWSDPVIEDVRRRRGAYAARFGYDLDAIFADLKAKECDGHRNYVTLSPKPPRFMPATPAGTETTNASSS